MAQHHARDGRAITEDEWHQSTAADRRVGDDSVICGDELVRASTIWLGLNKAAPGRPPLIFETMLFGGPRDLWARRYSTEAQAVAGHDQTVAALRAADLSHFDSWDS